MDLARQLEQLTRRGFMARSETALAGLAAAQAAGAAREKAPRKAGPAEDEDLDESLPGIAQGETKARRIATSPPLAKGQKFNESETFADLLTGRASRRLTIGRAWNQQPTYHLNACFSADSRYIVIATGLEDGGSALLRVEVATGELTVIATLGKASGEQFNGNNVSMIQATGQVACNPGKSVRLYHLETFEERVLLKNNTGFGHPIGAVDGKSVFIPRYDAPVTVGGVPLRPVTHMQIDLATGESRDLLHEPGAQCNHVVPCPGDPDLLLIDRDWPPKFGAGGDGGKTSRVWLLNIKTKKLTEIRPCDANRFQIHSNWSYKGDYVYYHGVSGTHDKKKNKGHYIGVADRAGKTVWEGHFPTFFYGHVSSHTRANVIITDGLLTQNLITAIHWEELNAEGVPRIEILAQHDSDWAPGQFSHPHCHVSPDGRWLSYNRGILGRSDVFVVKL